MNVNSENVLCVEKFEVKFACVNEGKCSDGDTRKRNSQQALANTLNLAEMTDHRHEKDN